MAEFTPINTQEEFDAAISKRLERERQKYEGYLSPEDAQAKYGEYLSPEDVEKRYNGYLSPDKAAEMENRLKEYEASSVKMRIALETGLPADLADRLQGADEASLREDAKKLMTYAKPQAAPHYKPEPGVETDPKKAALSRMLQQMKS